MAAARDEASPAQDAPDAALDLLCITTMRTLAIDAVEKANSGHPGTPMGMAPVAYTLWQRHLRYDPSDPSWMNRDRFVLSVGHASMLLYSTLFLAGVRAVDRGGEPTNAPALTLDDLKRFRQIDSKTPGHPEYHLTSGVETTTGPLGQGVANSVGMAIAGRWLAERYNRPGFTLFDYDIFALAGDGCMMEGVSSEAASLAGHLALSNLCWIYDSNRISIDGSTQLAFTEDTGARFLAYGWDVLRVGDANDLKQIGQAFELFRATRQRPTLIVVSSHIGYGSPHKQDTSDAHGEPLGRDEIKLTKRAYGWPEDAEFLVPDGVVEHFQAGVGARGKRLRDEWQGRLAAYRAAYPELAAELDHIRRRTLPEGWDRDLPSFPTDAKGVASRDSSAKALNAIAKNVPWVIGGSADLARSTKTTLTFEGAGEFGPRSFGRNLHFGVREHEMGSALNGLALSGLRVFGSGFLIFSDYMKPPIRLSAIMELPVVYVFTHDSIGVGEDGPTHQPIEQLASLRAVPGLITIRPADANEVVAAWRVIMAETHRPTALILSRQALPTIDRTRFAAADGLARGAYVLADAGDGEPEIILMATGSEVALALAAFERLATEGVRARVVSMPSWTLFEQQDEAYREAVLPSKVRARVGIEQAATMGWDRYTGLDGAIIAMHTFGASAPLKDLLEKFGFTPAKVIEAAHAQLAKSRARS